MIKHIDELDFSLDEMITILLKFHFFAVCPESGAMLKAAHGNPKAGNAPKYVLILPNKSVNERGGLLTNYEWDYPHGRKFIRAWTETEAIKLANKKLAKMVLIADQERQLNEC